MTSKRPRVLVMGGLGFIGTHVCRALSARGYPTRIFDRAFRPGVRRPELPDAIEIHTGSIENPADVLRALREIDVAIDLVHTTVPGTSMQNPAHDVRSNVEASANWLSQLQHTSLRRIVFVSSGGTVYGVPKSNPVDEDHPTDPICSYGITKLAIEKYVAMYANLYGIQYRIARPSNAYGEGQGLDSGQGVIGIFLKRALEKTPIDVWGNGTNQRDYVHVEDLSDGIVRLIEHEGESRTFNLSTGIGYSLNDIVTVIQNELREAPTVRYSPSRGFDVPANVLDSGRAAVEMGWRPRIDLAGGVQRVHGWLRNQMRAPDDERRDSPASVDPRAWRSPPNARDIL